MSKAIGSIIEKRATLWRKLKKTLIKEFTKEIKTDIFE